MISIASIDRRGNWSILMFLVLICGLVAGAGSVAAEFHLHRINQEGKFFVERAVKAIGENWDAGQLLDRATPQLRAELGETADRALAGASEQLGPFDAYMGAKGKVSWLSSLGVGGTISGSYAAQARFRDGLVTFQLKVVKAGGRWMIANFHFDGVMFNPLGPGLLQAQSQY